MLGNTQALNTCAIDLMEEEEHSEAAQVLQHAVSELQETLVSISRCCTLEQEDPKQHDHRNGIEHSRKTLDLRLIRRLTSSCDGNDDNITGPTSLGLFLNQPCCIEIMDQQGERSRNTQEETAQPRNNATARVLCLFGMACCFNLALCYHMQWWEQEQRKTGGRRPSVPDSTLSTPTLTRKTPSLLSQALENYQRACGFYEEYSKILLVVQGQQQEEASSGVAEDRASILLTRVIRDDPHVLLLLMAILANATHCSYELSQIEQARVWNKQLRRIMAWLLRLPAQQQGSQERRQHQGDVLLANDLWGDTEGNNNNDVDVMEWNSFFLHNAFQNLFCGTAAHAA